MEYYIEKEKKVFSYTIDGVEYTNTNENFMKEIGLSDSDILIINNKHVKFLNQLEFFEKKWRNRIIKLTDYLMIEDATVNDIEIRGTEKFDEIKAYRKALKVYKPKEEDRPIRPSWVKLNH